MIGDYNHCIRCGQFFQDGAGCEIVNVHDHCLKSLHLLKRSVSATSHYGNLDVMVPFYYVESLLCS